MARQDSNMRAKVLKVRKYDTIASRWAKGLDYLPPNKRRFTSVYEIVVDDGSIEYFDSHRAMSARREKLGIHVVYVHNLEQICAHDTPVYVVVTRAGKRVNRARYFIFENALERFTSDAEAVDLIMFGIAERPLHYNEAVIM